MSKTIGFKVTVVYTCFNMIGEDDFKEEFGGDPNRAYLAISDNHMESAANYAECEEVIKVEVIE